MRALESLERNDIARLPGGIFSRAVRAARMPSKWALHRRRQFRSSSRNFPDESVTAGHPTAKAHEDFEAVEGNRRAATTFLRLIALSIPIGAVLLYFATAGRRVPQPHPATDAPLAAAPSTLPAPALSAFVSGAGSPGCGAHTGGDVGGRLAQARHAVREPRLLDFRSRRRRKRHPADAAGRRAPDDRCQAGARVDSGRCGRRHVDAQWRRGETAREIR